MPDIIQQLDVEITVRSPLHIGSGRDLLQGYDFVMHEGRTWRVDEDALLDAALSGDAFDEALLGRPAPELLRPEDFQADGELFRYVLPGTPSAKSQGAQVVEQIKDVFDRPYLPGSSLKGALRTLFFWAHYATEERAPNLDRLKRSRSWASQPLTQQVFGRDPNHDWLRALRVRDSEPLPPGDGLALQTVRVYPTASRDSAGLDVDVEAIRPRTTFRTTIALETYGFESDQAARLGWQGKRRWIRELGTLGKKHAQQRLITESEYFRRKGGPRGALRFYDELIQRLIELPEDALLLQVGWGAGWESKTLGSALLSEDGRKFEDLLSNYRMTKERNRRPGDLFPKSRHLALRNGRPALPMGWLELRIAGLEAVEVREASAAPAGAARGQRTGRLKKYFPDKGYGFITPDGGGPDIFLHVSALAGPAADLREGQRLAFDVEQAAKGPRAVNVRVVG
jgi:CRISPR-associated protein Csm5